jgi:Raf kinase inhibitor-like YbhB/YbcL family protein
MRSAGDSRSRSTRSGAHYCWQVRRLAAVLACCALAACGGGEEVSAEVPTAIDVTSAAFAADEEVPVVYSCAGQNISPPLAWSGVPDDASELALVVDDPDAPRGTFTHWILFGLPTATSSLDEDSVPAGAKQAKNSAGRAEYAGPCPPSGTHHYRFTVYALDEPLTLEDGAATDEALDAISEHAIAEGRLVGLFTAR